MGVAMVMGISLPSAIVLITYLRIDYISPSLNGIYCSNSGRGKEGFKFCFDLSFCTIFLPDGKVLLINLHQKAVLHHFNFKNAVHDIKFSPNGRSAVQFGMVMIVTEA